MREVVFRFEEDIVLILTLVKSGEKMVVYMFKGGVWLAQMDSNAAIR